MKLRLVILTIFICCIGLLQSQPISFPAEKNMTSNEITPMTVGNDLKGYFATLLVEDLKKEDKSIYNLLIMDVNFKIIKDINL